MRYPIDTRTHITVKKKPKGPPANIPASIQGTLGWLEKLNRQSIRYEPQPITRDDAESWRRVGLGVVMATFPSPNARVERRGTASLQPLSTVTDSALYSRRVRSNIC